jgi:uncharacterized protein (TIGR00725 family)
MKKIGIIGPNDPLCSRELYDFGIELGREIAASERVIVCGGRGGFMEAVCRGVKQWPGSFPGQTLGILPEDTDENANPYVDIAIPTGIGLARNLIIINTADVIIAAGGGAGTLSELAFAWQRYKTVLCITSFGGWTANLAGKDLDARASGLLLPVSTIDEIKTFLSGSKI